MTQSAKPDDGSVPLTRRDLLRLGAVSAAGVPLVALAATHPTAGRPVPVDPEGVLEGEDRPEARARTIDNLKILGIALLNFAARNGGYFPPAIGERGEPVFGGRLPAAAICKDGKPLLSWRVAILPYLDQRALYERFHLDEPWDGPHNVALLKEIPPQYAAVAPDGRAPHSTYYQVFVGSGTLFDRPEGTGLADVADGLHSTLMVVEAAEPVPWTKPEDVSYDRDAPLPKLGGQFDDGFYFAFGDGSARFLGRKVAPGTLHALINRGDGEVVTFARLGPWIRPGPGGR